MIHLDGPIDFKSFSSLVNSEDFSLSNSLSAALNFSSDQKHYLLVPSASKPKSESMDSNRYPFLQFSLLDRDFLKLGVVTIHQINEDIFVITNNFGVPNYLSDALCCLSEYLEREFQAKQVFLASDSKMILETLQKLVSEVSTGGFEERFNLVPLLGAREELIPEIILTAGPSISVLENIYVQDATQNGWNSHHSDYITHFEKYFAEYVGAEYAMATSSCTGALHLALLALEIGPGDEVLVPDITWVATASAVRYVGAKPVFVDIDRETWTIDSDLISQLINRNTKAIIPVHLYGYGAPMREILKIAEQFNLKVIEDAAPAIGTKIGQNLAGSFGDFGCYSFQGAKLLVTGEGGMLVSSNKELMARARKIQDHGRSPGTFWIEELGYKYKMNNITAALGLAQIQRAQNQIERKRLINQWYTEGLGDLDTVSFQAEAPGTESICWMTSFTLNEKSKVNRDELITKLKKAGVDSRPVFPSISQYPIWGYQPQIPTNSKFIGDSGINLPSGVMLSRSAIDKVITNVRKILD